MAHSLASSSLMRVARPSAPVAIARRSNVVPCAIGKQQLVAQLADKLKTTKTAAGDALEAVIEIITESVTANEKVTITGFGSFERRERAARMGRNPKTGEPLPIKASFAPAFSAGKTFKDRVNGKVAEPKAPKPAKAPKADAAPKAPKPAAKSAPKPAAPKPAAPKK